MNSSTVKRRFWLNFRIASFWLSRSCERVETRRQATVFKAASKERQIAVCLRQIAITESGLFNSRLFTKVTVVYLDTWP